MTRGEVIVIGGGAAGMMAARCAAAAGAAVTLLERNEKVGRKLYITGKGRCNLTNNCPPQQVLAHIPGNARFLTGAVHRMPPSAVMELFEELGVALKTERGSRVFPASDRAADVIDALWNDLRRRGVKVVRDRAAALELREGRACAVVGERGRYEAGAVVLATGGASYPATGSTGDGYALAASAGHTIVEPRPSLVPLEVPGEECRRMQGLSLRNVELRMEDERGKTLFREKGELLFTHFGLSGPLVLSASAHLREFGRRRYTAHIDLKPALDEATLDARLVRELSAGANRDMSNLMGELLPRLMIAPVLERAGIPGERKAHDLTRGERRRLLETLKDFALPISAPRPLAEAIVTAGGVSVKEIDPRTMASKKVPGLFFAGEVMDVDGYTGGFNLHIAWATGAAAGESAAVFAAGEGEE